MGATVTWFKYAQIQLAFEKKAFEFFQYIC